MGLPDFAYLAPTTVEEAIGILEEHGADTRIIGGGTDLLPAMRHGLARLRSVVSLAKVPQLAEIVQDENGALRIGASVRLRKLATSPLVAERFPLLQQAARAVGSPQLREMGTVGGNVLLGPRCCFYNRSEFWRSCRAACLKAGGEICNAVGSRTKCFAAFSGDLAPALVALRATAVVVSSQGERALPLEDVYTGDGLRPLSLSQGEILKAIVVPGTGTGTGTAGVYLKRRLRDSIDFPLVSCALVRTTGDGAIDRVRIVLGAVASRPLVIEGVEETLTSIGRADGEVACDSATAQALASLAWKQAKPVENVLGVTAVWRRATVRELVATSWNALDRSPALPDERRPR